MAADLLVLGSSVAFLVVFVLLVLAALGAGTLGSLLGMGGGVTLVPVLVLVFGLDIHLAVAASLVSVIATSTGAASTQVESGYTNLRLGMFLETATATGGLIGALLAVTTFATRGSILILVFVPVVLSAAVLMFLHRRVDIDPATSGDRLSSYLGLGGRCPDPEGGGTLEYRTTRTGTGLAISGLAGIASGLLGIGGGLFKVPAMNAVMNVPIRAAGATSTLMIGVTAAAGALVYLFAGDVALLVAAPTTIGTLVGSRLGSDLRHRLSVPWIKELFVIVLVGAAASMLAQVTGVIP